MQPDASVCIGIADRVFAIKSRPPDAAQGAPASPFGRLQLRMLPVAR
jgi:hypothetical protein